MTNRDTQEKLDELARRAQEAVEAAREALERLTGTEEG